MPYYFVNSIPILLGGALMFSAAAHAGARNSEGKVRGNIAIWAGGVGLWSDLRNWVNRQYMVGPESTILIDDGNSTQSVASLDIDVAVGNLLVDRDDTVHVLDDASMEIASTDSGVIDLQGVLYLHGGGEPSELIIGCGGPVSVSGIGNITLSDSSGSRIRGACQGAMFINSASIHGAGEIGAGSLQIQNSGTIHANRPFELITIAPSPAGAANVGVLMASHGGILRLADGEFNNLGGSIRAEDFSYVDLENVSILEGVLETSGSGVIRAGSTENQLTNVTLNGLLELGVVRLMLAGDFINNGVVELLADSSLDGFSATEIVLRPGVGNVRVNGSGEFNMSWGVIHSGEAAMGGHLVHEEQHTIRGAGYIGNNTIGITNRGTIDADSGLPMVIDPINSIAMTNTGTLRASGTGGLVLTGGTFDNSGTLEVLPNSRCVFTGLANLANISGSALIGGVWRVVAGDETAIILSSAPNLFFNAADVTLSGPNSSFPIIHSIANNSGRFTLDDRRQFTAVNTFFSNDGDLSIENGSMLTVNGSFSQSDVAHTHVGLNAASLVPGYVAIRVNGTALLGGTLAITVSSDLHLLAGKSFTLLSASNAINGFQSIHAPPGMVVSVQGGLITVAVGACVTDLNGNGWTGIDDMLILLQQWGPCPVSSTCTSDLNGDGGVNSADLVLLMDGWGPCSP